jgi:putative MATE family efflux protein
MKRKTLGQLFVPIFLETLFFMIMGSVDTLMLSAVGDQKVGAVGAANTYLSLFTITFSVISNGVLAVMTQYIGAKKVGVARQALRLGLLFNGILGGLLSFLLFFFSEAILKALGVASFLLPFAITYMKIVGVSSIFTALSPIFSSYLRAFGYAKESLISNIVANLVNVILNALFIYALKTEVEGVAYSTLIARVIALGLVILFTYLKVHIPKDAEKIRNKIVIYQIMKIGFPSALESLLYNVAMTLVMKLLNQMDEEGTYVTIRSYASQISNFSYCAGSALASANAIIVGWNLGEKKIEECKKGTLKVSLLGIAITLPLSVLIALFSPFIMKVFTNNTKIIQMTTLVLWIDVALELGRTTNLIVGQALKTSGDAVFTVIIAAIFMFLFAVFGTWLFGLKLKWMILGSYLGLALDECMRGLFMTLRWISGKWKKKIFTT